MRAAMYISGVSIHRATSGRLRALACEVSADATSETLLALDWEGRPIGVARLQNNHGHALCHVTLSDHPEREAVLLALVKAVWRQARDAKHTRLEITGTPLASSSLSPPFALELGKLPARWQAFFALPHRYLSVVRPR